jgi:SAM-dependent methyltransferase
MATQDSTQRFSDRVADYVRYRPGYPRDVLSCLTGEFGLRTHHVVAEPGSGTGIFTEMLLEAGHTVFAVEPNPPMRRSAEQLLSRYPGFCSTSGTAESTTLPDGCADWLIAAQAFHWFDAPKARVEALRILRRPAMAALLWNNRLEDTAFLRDYESLLMTFGTDYERIKHQNAESDGRIPQFFGSSAPVPREFPNAQVCDFDVLRGRTLSASYMPAADHPRHEAMLVALEAIFSAHAVEGTVTIEYRTRMYAGPLEVFGHLGPDL